MDNNSSNDNIDTKNALLFALLAKIKKNDDVNNKNDNLNNISNKNDNLNNSSDKNDNLNNGSNKIDNSKKMYIKFPEENYDVTNPNMINIILSKQHDNHKQHIIEKNNIIKNNLPNNVSPITNNNDLAVENFLKNNELIINDLQQYFNNNDGLNNNNNNSLNNLSGLNNDNNNSLDDLSGLNNNDGLNNSNSLDNLSNLNNDDFEINILDTPIFNNFEKDILTNKIIVKFDSSTINPDCYHRYSHDLNQTIRIKDINLLNFDIPKQSIINISDDNNKFTINNHNFVIPNNYYNKFTLMDKINVLLSEIFGNDIILSLENNYYKFTGNKKFMLIENSILLNMGFIKNSYVNKTEYLAEKYPNIGDNVFYLSIDSVSNEIMFIVDNDEKKVIKQNVKMVDYSVDSIDIHFHLNNSINNGFFYDLPHSLEFELFVE